MKTIMTAPLFALTMLLVPALASAHEGVHPDSTHQGHTNKPWMVSQPPAGEPLPENRD
jgi:hypothetical protein